MGVEEELEEETKKYLYVRPAALGLIFGIFTIFFLGGGGSRIFSSTSEFGIRIKMLGRREFLKWCGKKARFTFNRVVVSFL